MSFTIGERKNTDEFNRMMDDILENHNPYGIVRVKPIIKKPTQINLLRFPLEEPDYSSVDKNNRIKDSIIGKVFSSNFGPFRVLKFVEKDTRGVRQQNNYEIQFLTTGYKMYTRKVQIERDKQIKDPYMPNIYGIGIKGKYYGKTNYDKRIYKLWEGLFDRCYNEKNRGNKKYRNYYEKNIFVDNRWCYFDDFYEDIKHIPNYEFYIKNPHGYQLDKDYLKSNAYSKDTCVFLSNSENRIYIDSKPFLVVKPNNEFYLEISINRVSNKEPITASTISKHLRGELKSSKLGYKFIPLNDKEYVYRYHLK